MALSRQHLSEPVGRHISCRQPVDDNLLPLDFLPKPVLVDIDVFQLGVELRFLLVDDPHRLRVIAP